MSSEREKLRTTLVQIANGSTEAAEYFVKKFGPHIRRAVRRRLSAHMRSQFDSMDFEQMVWASVFRKPECLDYSESPQQLVSFLTKLARNKVLDAARRPCSTELSGVDPSSDSAVALPSVLEQIDPATPSQFAMARERLDRMFSTPSEQNRRIMQMRMDGASYLEIAQQLQIGETKVRQLVERLAGGR